MRFQCPRVLFAAIAFASLLATQAAQAAAPTVAPSDLRFEVGDAQLTFAWNPVPDATGYQYRLKAGKAGYGPWTSVAGGTTHHRASGLTNGVVYRFKVRAVNGSRKGPSSGAISATPLALRHPGSLRAVAGNAQVTLTWDAVPSATGYHYRSKENADDWGAWNDIPVATTTMQVVSGLRNDTPHTFAVRAKRRTERGPAAEVTAIPHVPLPAPQNLAAYPENTAVLLQWDSLAAAAGYEHRLASNAVWTATTTTSVRVSGLAVGRSYTFEVRGAHAYRVAAVATVTATTTSAAPALRAPANLVATPGDRTVALAWDAAPGASAYEYRVGTRGAWTSVSGRTATAANLINGQVYEFQVRGLRGTGSVQTPGPFAAVSEVPRRRCGGEFANVGAVRDCETLLAAKSTLDAGGVLNWQRATALADWTGITHGPGGVTAIDLRNRGLRGRFPAALGTLSQLQTLRLSKNDLEGTLPSQFAALTRLEHLDLGDTKLSDLPDLSALTKLKTFQLKRTDVTGVFPTWLPALRDLEHLDLFKCRFSGSIPNLGGLTKLKELWIGPAAAPIGPVPAWLRSLRNLEHLELRGGLSGTIPSWLSDLTKLKTLALSQGTMTGGVPDSLHRLTVLETLHIDNVAISGTIPTNITTMTNLKRINLSYNRLSGTIPSGFSSMTALEHLVLDYNRLEGSIPSVRNLTRMRILDLSNNKLEGQLPAGIWNLTKLLQLRLHGNALEGSIASDIGSLTELTGLRLDGNKLTGGIPTELGTLVSLQYIFLGHNQLNGEIPTNLGSLTKLWALDLSSNDLSGPIPTSLGSLSKMRYLSLYRNRLNGTIPTILGDLAELRDLVLAENQLDGQIPASLGKLSNLTGLVLNDNRLTGGIPAKLGDLATLTVMRLNDNHLNGAIPTALGTLRNLTVLNLSDNDLSQNIPRTLGNISSLTNLYLENNDLTGHIPTTLGNLTFEELRLYGNNLQGTIPSTLARYASTINPQQSGNLPVAGSSGTPTLSQNAPRLTSSGSGLAQRQRVAIQPGVNNALMRTSPARAMRQQGLIGKTNGFSSWLKVNWTPLFQSVPETVWHLRLSPVGETAVVPLRALLSVPITTTLVNRHHAHSADTRLARAVVVGELLVVRANASGRSGRVTVLLSPADRRTPTAARLLVTVGASPSVDRR